MSGKIWELKKIDWYPALCESKQDTDINHGMTKKNVEKSLF